jgi:hypothetical protein
MAGKIAGIDVQKKVRLVVVVDARAPESKPERRRFGAILSELRRLASSLGENSFQRFNTGPWSFFWLTHWFSHSLFLSMAKRGDGGCWI